MILGFCYQFVGPLPLVIALSRELRSSWKCRSAGAVMISGFCYRFVGPLAPAFALSLEVRSSLPMKETPGNVSAWRKVLLVLPLPS